MTNAAVEPSCKTSLEKRVDVESGNEPTAQESPRQLHGWKWAVAYSAMLSTTFLFALDNTIVADIQPSIINSMGRIELLPWVGTGFALGSLAVLPWGKAYGVFEIRGLYLFNILLFEAGSAVCGAARGMPALIVGRVVAGIGGCGMYSGTLTYVSVSTSMKERPAYLAGSTVVWGIGSVLGPVVGGAFAISRATWRWGFYINLVIGAVFAPAYILLFPRIDPRPNKSMADKLRMIDWPMTVAFLGGTASLVTAISFGGMVYAWDSAAMIALWTMAGVLVIAEVALARYHPGVVKEDRLYPAHFFRSSVLMNLQLQVFLSSGIILAMTYYIPLFFQFARGDGPLDAGIRLLPLIVFMVVVSMVNGFLMPKFTLVSPWYIGGSVIVVIGAAVMCTVNTKTSNATIYGATILVGAGAGCYIVAGFALVQSLVSSADIPNAVGAMTISQTLGMVLFLAVSGSIFQNTAIERVGAVLSHATLTEISDLMAGTSSAVFKSLSDADRAAVVPQITDSMKNVWILYAVAGALSFVFSFPLFQLRLHVAPGAA